MNKKISKFKLTILFATTFLFLFTGVILTTYTQTQESVRSENRINHDIGNIPVVNFEDSEIHISRNGMASPQEIEQRLKNNERYNKLNAVWELPIGVLVKPKSTHWANNVPALPVEQSSEIVIGIVKTSEAFLSNDKTGVYSEFLISSERFLKLTFLSQEDQEILTERVGGGVRFPSGRVQRIEIFRGQELPQVGSRYIFFLKKLEGEKDFSILTAYELKAEKVVPLDTVDPFTRYKNKDEAKFIREVVNAIKKINARKRGNKAD